MQFRRCRRTRIRRLDDGPLKEEKNRTRRSFRATPRETSGFSRTKGILLHATSVSSATNRPRPRRRSRPRPLVSDLVIEKVVIDRTNRMIPLACKEVEDENEDDWGRGGRQLRPNIAGIVCIKTIDQSGQHCYNTPRHFLKTVCK